MELTTNYEFELLAPSQEQPEVPLNFNWNKLDALLLELGAITVGDITVNSPADSPAVEFAAIRSLLFRGATVEHETGGVAIVTIDSSPIPNCIVSALPAAPPTGTRGFVTDATAPTFLGALTGGGAVGTPVIYDGAAWVAG